LAWLYKNTLVDYEQGLPRQTDSIKTPAKTILRTRRRVGRVRSFTKVNADYGMVSASFGQ